ncbi:MAG: YbjQ family protein [Chloroflexi bacterium]|nr:YbjQ family protein [Chloroflexota bacterium]
MIITTVDTIEDKKVVEVFGLVMGTTVRARHLGRDFMAGLRNIVGGEITEYSRLLAESREQSLSRMTERAVELGANAVVGLRFSTSVITGGAAEILAYGTAVKVE